MNTKYYCFRITLLYDSGDITTGLSVVETEDEDTAFLNLKDRLSETHPHAVMMIITLLHIIERVTDKYKQEGEKCKSKDELLEFIKNYQNN